MTKDGEEQEHSGFLLYPESATSTLELDGIAQMVANRCSTAGGQDLLDAWMIPLTEEGEWTQRRQAYQECFAWLKRGSAWPSLHWELKDSIWPYLATEGYVLNEDQTAQLWPAVRTALGMLHFAEKHAEALMNLRAQLRSLPSPDPAYKAMVEVLGQDGRLSPQASPALARLTVQLQRKQQEAREWMEAFLRKARESGWATDLGVTLRDDRYVMVLNAEGRKQVDGIVHDVSASGQHFYVEPAQASTYNNDLRECEWAIRREKYRLLAQLSEQIRPHAVGIRQWASLVYQWDVLQAVCSWSLQFPEANFPRLEAGVQDWMAAYHPLLWMEGQTKGVKIWPYSWRMSPEQRFLVVSGPNAGGKSVFLKTVGLLQILFQCGWPLPCDASSVSCLMQGVVLGMGDRQNLHQDLSTYAAHLQLMAHALKVAGSDHLILLDEFGAGTDPALGGPLAEALLEPWLREGPKVLLNTHYGNLKRLASQWPTVQDARMGFDTTTLKPTYQLLVGAPGSSYAMELARRAGLPDTVLARATELTETTDLQSENLLVEWMDQKQKAEELLKLSQYKEELLDKLLRKQEVADQEALSKREELSQNLRNKGRRLLEEQRRAMGFVLQQFKTDLDELRKDLRSISPMNAPGAAWNKALQALEQGALQLQSMENKLLESTRLTIPPQDASQNQDESQGQAPGQGQVPAEDFGSAFKVGQLVKFRDGQLRGEVLNSNAKETEWMVESVRMRTETARLIPASPFTVNNPFKALSKRNPKAESWAPKAESFVPKAVEGGPLPNQVVDLRGLRMHEWELPLQQRLDRAVVAGEDRIYVLHGKGTGALRQGVRDYLKRQHHVKGLQDAPMEAGGSGWTWVDLG